MGENQIEKKYVKEATAPTYTVIYVDVKQNAEMVGGNEEGWGWRSLEIKKIKQSTARYFLWIEDLCLNGGPSKKADYLPIA